jgi:hypothetical protein
MTIEERMKDIREHPEKHRHSFEGLTACCMNGGALNLSLQDAHERYAPLGRNGGWNCDVTKGPCSCGAWH